MTTQTQVRSTDEALKLALEALIKTQNEGYNLPGSAIREAITAIKEALMSQSDVAQQNPQGVSNEQVEPVAWAIGSHIESDYVFAKETPLYTTPPQRTWVGLTDEERTQLWGAWENGHVVEATEAKLKEKNNVSQ